MRVADRGWVLGFSQCPDQEEYLLDAEKAASSRPKPTPSLGWTLRARITRGTTWRPRSYTRRWGSQRRSIYDESDVVPKPKYEKGRV